MSLYDSWKEVAYTQDAQINSNTWNDYLPKEQKIYEYVLENKQTKLSGTLKELADKFQISNIYMMGFIDGINEVLPEAIELDDITEDSQIELTIDFEKLYKKMVEYKAEHLYSLEQWKAIYSEEELQKMYKEQKISRTVVKDPKVGRNDPCPCGSGKKYKKCCGA